MKRLLFFAAIVLTLTGCSALKVPTAEIKGNVLDYPYAYVIPTSGVTSSSGVYGNQYGVYGGSTKTINPSEVISGYLMKLGYTVLPSVSPELAEKTLIISYGYTGRRQLSLFSYASCIIIQMRDAKTHNMVASCEAEGCGEDETADILQAIYKGLDKIFSKQ
ncbi:MAG: membrane lipoprotein lipid attachment site-containing protein [Prevotella sp.]|nr:membrane lipoprotein lipid attachment site-containing protein [Prevotella sp.]